MSRGRLSTGSARAQSSTLVITNLAKVTGIVIAVLEWNQPGPAQDSVLALCAVFVLGVEAVERVAMTLIRGLLGRDESS